jgi:NAD(P)-dependent dehydrogenase (short-subunit alcohol dehydrogenase family)
MNEELLDAGALGGRPMPDLSPQHVADVVAYLASDDAGDITGRIIHAAGGEIREYTTRRSAQTELVARLSALSR